MSPPEKGSPVDAERALAEKLAGEILQRIADSEPSEATDAAQEILSGTPVEHLYCLEGDVLERSIAHGIANALTDGVLFARSVPAGTWSPEERKRLEEIRERAAFYRLPDAEKLEIMRREIDAMTDDEWVSEDFPKPWEQRKQRAIDDRAWLLSRLEGAPSAADRLTPEERRRIDAAVAEVREEIRPLTDPLHRGRPTGEDYATRVTGGPTDG